VTLTGNDATPILFFEAYPIGSSVKSPQSSEQETILVAEKLRSEKLDSTLNDEFVLLKVAPNPTSGKIMVSLELPRNSSATYKILNPNGAVLSKKEVIEPNFSIDLSVYRRGVYYLVVQTDSKTEIRKIVRL